MNEQVVRATHPVRQHAVPHGDRRARRLRDAVPAVRLLRDCSEHVVVPIERHERAELHPAVAQLFVSVIVEPTRVRADHWDLEELELEHALDIVVQICPSGVIISKPVSCPFARGRVHRTGDHEGTLALVESK